MANLQVSNPSDHSQSTSFGQSLSEINYDENLVPLELVSVKMDDPDNDENVNQIPVEDLIGEDNCFYPKEDSDRISYSAEQSSRKIVYYEVSDHSVLPKSNCFEQSLDEMSSDKNLVPSELVSVKIEPDVNKSEDEEFNKDSKPASSKDTDSYSDSENEARVSEHSGLSLSTCFEQSLVEMSSDKNLLPAEFVSVKIEPEINESEDEEFDEDRKPGSSMDRDSYSESEDEVKDEHSTYLDHKSSQSKKSEKSYFCERCDVPFSDYDALFQHCLLLKHYACGGCDKTFGGEKGLVHHLKKEHFIAKPHICGICLRAFERRNNLIAHQKCVHVKLKPYVCETCKQSFAAKQSLMKHCHAVHLRERSFSCMLCGKSFTRKDSLVLHNNLVHLKLKPFKCEVCNSSFPSTSNLYTHQKTHTNISPYVCPVCNKAFKQKFGMIKHAQSKHKSFNIQT